MILSTGFAAAMATMVAVTDIDDSALDTQALQQQMHKSLAVPLGKLALESRQAIEDGFQLEKPKQGKRRQDASQETQVAD